MRLGADVGPGKRAGLVRNEEIRTENQMGTEP